jgi:hypothetical protein
MFVRIEHNSVTLHVDYIALLQKLWTKLGKIVQNNVQDNFVTSL